MKLLGYFCALLFAAGLCACQSLPSGDNTDAANYGSSTPR